MVASYIGNVQITRKGDVISTSFLGMGQSWDFDYEITIDGDKGPGIYLTGIPRGGRYSFSTTEDAADEMELNAEKFVIARVLSYLAEEHSDINVYITEATRNLLAGNKAGRYHTITGHNVVE